MKLTVRLLSTCFLFLATTSSLLFAQDKAPAKPLTIEAIFADGGIGGRGPEALKWSPDGSRLSYVQRDDAGDHGQLWAVDAATGKASVLVSEDKLASLAPPVEKIKDEREKERLTRYSVAAYHWAPDSKHILFDSHGQLWLYSLESGTDVQFTSNPEPTDDPKFSPDGKLISFVRGHNLFVRSLDGQKEKQLTNDSTKNRDKDKKDNDNNILNGEVDWVYAEELGVRSNQFWSPDSRQLVFLQTDETHVPTYPITNWMPAHPNVEMEKYPEVGDPNPVVRLGIAGAGGGKVKWIKLTDDTDTYLPRFGWVRNGVIWAEILNRAQTKLDLYFVEVSSGRSRKVLTETASPWVNVNDDFRILKNGKFLWTSWRDGHTHLYVYSFDAANPLAADAKLERQITHGDFEVISVDAVDEDAGSVFLTANEGDARQQHVYSVQLDGSGFHRLTKGEGTEGASFAENAKHFVSRVSSNLEPPRMSFCAVGGDCNPMWQSRDVSGYGLTPPKFLDFRAEDGTVLHGSLLLPKDAKNKIPLVVYVYGGPAGQTVSKAWDSTETFHQLLAQQGFAVFSVDNRGTPNRGKAFNAAIHLQLGAVELRDQLAALNQLLDQYPQLDRDHMAIWGWSNGAAMTLFAMTHSQVFRAGVAVAPVTDQRNYDSIYSERMMGLLPEGVKAYEDSASTRSAANLHGSLLLVHGTSDDNVHMQNSIQLIDALINAGKPFRLMLYPNKTHGIAGPKARTHLFHMIEEHFERELMGK